MAPPITPSTEKDWKPILLCSLERASRKLALENCFNPLLASVGYDDIRENRKAVKLWNKSLEDSGLPPDSKVEDAVYPVAAALNSLYYEWLDALSGNIQQRLTLDIAAEFGYNLDGLCALLKDYDIPANSFLEFSGTFSSCEWLVSEHKQAEDFPFHKSHSYHNSIIVPKESLASEEMRKVCKATKTVAVDLDRDLLGSAADHPSNIMKHWLKGLESIETKNIDTIRRPNPFLELLLGRLYPAILDDVRLCIDNPIFRGEYVRLISEQNKDDSAKKPPGERGAPGSATKHMPEAHSGIEKHEGVEWSVEAFPKTKIGRIASKNIYTNDKSFRDYVDRMEKKLGVPIIKQTKAANKCFVNLTWICNERSDLTKDEILKLLRE